MPHLSRYRKAPLTFDPLTRYPRQRGQADNRGGKPIALTAKEYALLEYLLLHRNKVHTRDELFNGVWGSDLLGDSNLIDVYIRYLRAKIDKGFSPPLILTRRSRGYMLRADEEPAA